MPANGVHHEPLTQDELNAVRDTAYFMWENEGRPEGRAQEFWRRAMEQHRRAKAYGIWLEDGQPEGKAEEHWHKAGAGK
jgi:hypothetical protein